MSKMVSNAQNFEDIYIFRAHKLLQNTYGMSQDFTRTIVDIGAWEPVADSVSALFIELGWSAYLFEPQPALYTKIQNEYGRNSNVYISNYAISDDEDTATIFVPIVTTGWASLNKEHAEHMNEDLSEIQVLTTTLDNLHAKIKSNYFVLKIDAEENEIRILNGWKKNEYSPTIICIEGSNSQITSILKDKNYSLFFFDGINSYFVKKIYIEALKHFNPLNVLEDNNFILRPGTWLIESNYTLK